METRKLLSASLSFGKFQHYLAVISRRPIDKKCGFGNSRRFPVSSRDVSERCATNFTEFTTMDAKSLAKIVALILVVVCGEFCNFFCRLLYGTR